MNFFTNRYKYNVDQICYINYVHLNSLEAGIFLIFKQFIMYSEPLRRTIGFLLPQCCLLFSTIRSLSCALISSLSENPGRKNQALRKIFLGLFYSYSRNNQDCLLLYSLDTIFPSTMSFRIVKSI